MRELATIVLVLAWAYILGDATIQLGTGSHRHVDQMTMVRHF